jgi:hydrogenase-4 component E
MTILPFNPFAALLVVLALCMLGVTQFRSNVLLYGLQSIILGLLAMMLGRQHAEPVLVFVGFLVILAKGVAVPWYFIYAAHKIGCRRDVGMILAPPLLLFLAVGGLSLLLLLHPYGSGLPSSADSPMALLLLGMLLMMARRLAVSQIIGFLVLENGIFLFTILQPHSMPLLVEIGVLMDVLAGTMLAGLLTFHINRTFEHIDVREMKELRG